MALRGYADWKPKDETAYWITMVRGVLEEYRSYLPISLRQIFYRLVAEHGYEKTERAYNRLGTWVARARRAQMLPFDAIRDDQGRASAVQDFADQDAFWDLVKDHANAYRRERMTGQPVRMELWSEAGMTEQLTRVAWRYGIPVYSSRGFASVTNSHSVAERAMAADVPTVLLHVGDYDPSGESIFESLTQDALSFLLQETYWMIEAAGKNAVPPSLQEYRGTEGAERWLDETRKQGKTPAGPDLIPVRVALTWEQVEEHDVETAPPKSTDSRTKNWVGETAQAEALPPDLLQEIVTDAIEERLDMDRYEEEVAKEEADREAIEEKLP